MHLTIGNTTVVVTHMAAQEWGYLVQMLTVTGAPDLDGDPTIHTFYGMNDATTELTFATGLLTWIAATWQSAAWPITWEDNRTPYKQENCYPYAKLTFTPYFDQFEVALLMIQAYRGVLDLATNYGKTFLLAYFWFKIGCPTMLVVVPTKILLHQTAQDMADCLAIPVEEIGKVGDGMSRWKPCTVAVSNSVADHITKKGRLPYDFQVLFVDEGDVGKSERYIRISVACDKAVYRFWMSGTPYEGRHNDHKMAMTALAGPCVAQVKNKYLVAKGRSSYPNIWIVQNRLDDLAAYSPENYHAQYKALKQSEQRNDLVAAIAQEAAEAGLTVMVFVEHVDHAKEIQKGMPWAHVVTGQSGDSRHVKQGLINGTIDAVICTSTWRRGVSIPGVDVLIQATGRKAPHARNQEFGRVLRLSERGQCWYIDFSDYGLSRIRAHALTREVALKAHEFPVYRVEPHNIASIFANVAA